MKKKLSGMTGLFVVLLSLTASSPPALAAASQSVFPTPEKAVDALVFAARNDHTSELLKILGPTSEKLVFSGDKVADNAGRERFTAAYDKAHRLDDAGNGRVTLTVGDMEWPMPIPLVHVENGWRFDTRAGENEILNRRIGRDELNVIEVCRAYVEAQRDYLDDKHEYAQNIQSSAGKQDGLYWPVKDDEKESPLGPLIATAADEGYTDTSALDKHEPYQGYYYKILKSQGEHAAGGAKDYMKDGKMTEGFALLAFPAKYGDSGVMTFIVNQNGIVYQKNLGPETPGYAGHITSYNPDESWVIVR